MKGIILAGGSGTRLYPITKGISKQLLPVFDKPMIYYPLSTLMLAGIREILIITTPQDAVNFKALLGDGKDFGVNFSYVAQPSPDGLAQAFILGEEFLGDSPSCLVLGDNIFYGNGFTPLLESSIKSAKQGVATIFGYKVRDPQRYGIAEFNEKGEVVGLEEKPSVPKSDYAVTGLYFYPSGVSELAKKIRPSARGELEITTLNEMYLKQSKLRCELMGRGFAWLDTGTHDSLLEASSFIQTLQKRQNLKIACLEEIAFEKGWINADKLQELGEKMSKNEYGKYLLNLLE
ncbi:glucose-1-phosphate thymidylyltransferase RfbA [Campylobacter troglodytis]|uniref:glucose-1-phosphate thymidylyltransferase RfbA n=1 Tax=Campylobacter troglodytis TaxID=654363 RepID=UPI00115A887A|nr:glucose-1-phosphate thymidylyltransferase RfbA [Campylobacter troglodytis]TQR60307.1 glucose-1-phosphate thymidylyltransferase [Campylobacter troglodytis]